jgi:membrane protease YdiL (CAAX protease family)
MTLADRQDDQPPGRGLLASSALFNGPPRFEPRGPWRPIPALAVAIVYSVAMLVAAVLLGVMATVLLTGADYDNFTDREDSVTVTIAFGLWQAAVVGGLFWVAGWRGGKRRDVLQLTGPIPRWTEILVAFGGITIVTSLIGAIFYVYDPAWYMENYRADMEMFLAEFRGPINPLRLSATVATVVIGAPLSEELLFRGFLMSALAKWRWGFWPAAVLVSLIWTVIHLYSVTSSIEIFISGLCLSWLLWRTGNIWLPIICHALMNVWALVFATIYVLS